MSRDKDMTLNSFFKKEPPFLDRVGSDDKRRFTGKLMICSRCGKAVPDYDFADADYWMCCIACLKIEDYYKVMFDGESDDEEEDDDF